MADDYATAPLNTRERALVEYAAKLTSTPGRMQEMDLKPLREAGLTDRDILDTVLVIAYFAYVNRIADGLGVVMDAYMREQEADHG